MRSSILMVVLFSTIVLLSSGCGGLSEADKDYNAKQDVNRAVELGFDRSTLEGDIQKLQEQR